MAFCEIYMIASQTISRSVKKRKEARLGDFFGWPVAHDRTAFVLLCHVLSRHVMFDSAPPPAQKIAKPPFISAFSTTRPIAWSVTMKIHFTSSDISHRFTSLRVTLCLFLLVHAISYRFISVNVNVIYFFNFSMNCNALRFVMLS